jgi:hypothetical protein
MHNFPYALFAPPLVVTLVVFVLLYLWGGVPALLTAFLLTILEVTLSFDNAVVNAKILKNMPPLWQKRFLTWGILVAVFGTRAVLPILIVSLSLLMSPVVVTKLALFDPGAYGKLLEHAHIAIAAFGGAFLLMVSLKYFIDDAKSVHWIHFVERHLAKWGRVEAIEIALALTVILLLGWMVPHHSSVILMSGIIGVVLFILIQGIAGTFSNQSGGNAHGGLLLFIYLNILDSAFSLDGVVGAFAISSSLPVIIVGLGIGAYVVRTFTVYMVREKMLDVLVYLEHGAHWAILGLALSMLLGLLVHIPEVVTGLVGLVFVLLAYISSARERQR